MTGVSTAHGSFKTASAALMTPVGNLSTASVLSTVPPRIKPIRFLRSSLAGWTNRETFG